MQRKNGVDVSIDAEQLEGMSTEDLQRKYNEHSRGGVHVPGAGRSEDFSDMVAKESAKRKQKAETDRDRKKGKEFKF